jgi:hypothetical protein
VDVWVRAVGVGAVLEVRLDERGLGDDVQWHAGLGCKIWDDILFRKLDFFDSGSNMVATLL